MSSYCWAATCLLMSISSSGYPHRLPPQLNAAIQNRLYPHCRIEYQIEWFDQVAPLHYGIAEVAGDDLFVVRQFVHPPGSHKQDTVSSSLIHDGLAWTGGGAKAEAVQEIDALAGWVNPRTIGLSNSFSRHFRDHIRDAGDDWVVTHETPDMVVVRSTTGDTYEEWTVNPRKGWSIERYRQVAGGEAHSECISLLKQYGEIWYPASVLFFRTSHKNGTEPYLTFTIREAVFNEPKHAISPSVLGIDVGSDIVYVAKGQKPVLKKWDGERIQDAAVVREKLARGELKKQGVVPAYTGYISAVYIAPTEFDPDLWESYVLGFIKKYRLDPDQTAKAWAIHAACKEQADQYLRSRASEFEAYKRSWSEARSDGRLTRAESNALQERREQLMAPVARLFHEQLVPRLAKLPTRAQKTTAEVEIPEKEAP